jgi:hypothetical protein
MKNYSLLLIGSLLITQCAISQNFISEGKRWNVKEDNWGDIITEIFKIEGDSNVNTINYKKVWRTDDSTMINWWLTGLIREDSGKVYFKNEYGEGLLYDFNLEAGDTAYVTNLYCEEIQIIIDSVDTVNYFGVDWKRFSLAWSEEYWFEGIGSTCGPFHSSFFNCIFDVWFELLCFSENDTLLYIKQGENDCFQYFVGLQEK